MGKPAMNASQLVVLYDKNATVFKIQQLLKIFQFL